MCTKILIVASVVVGRGQIGKQVPFSPCIFVSLGSHAFSSLFFSVCLLGLTEPARSPDLNPSDPPNLSAHHVSIQSFYFVHYKSANVTFYSFQFSAKLFKYNFYLLEHSKQSCFIVVCPLIVTSEFLWVCFYYLLFLSFLIVSFLLMCLVIFVLAIVFEKKKKIGNSLVIQWLELYAMLLLQGA